MTASTALRRRSHETWLSRRYTTLAGELAGAGHFADALACQSMADVHRVSAVLWTRASSAHDPVETFFDLASQVMRTVIGIAPRDAVDPAQALASMRAALAGALEGFNLPISFTAPPWLTRSPLVQTEQWRRAVLGEAQWKDYVDSTLARAGEQNDPERAAGAVMAYLVQIAGAAGDESMMTATARWLLISSEVDPESDVDLLTAARKVLGAVEWVRMAPIRTLLGL